MNVVWQPLGPDGPTITGHETDNGRHVQITGEWSGLAGDLLATAADLTEAALWCAGRPARHPDPIPSLFPEIPA